MKNPYKHIVLLNGLPQEDLPSVLRKTMIYWVGEPTKTNMDLALSDIDQVDDLIISKNLLATVIFAAIEFKLLDPVDLAKYDADFMKLRADILDTKGMEQTQFLNEFDEKIDVRVRKLEEDNQVLQAQIKKWADRNLANK